MSERYAERVVEAFGAFDLEPHLVALGYVGSISHGTHGEVIDDVDLMGIVVPPPRHVIGLGQWQHWVHQKDELDVVLYSAHKMVSLMLKQNPNVLGFLWLEPEHIVHRSPWFDRLVESRDAFISKGAYKSFSGYAYSQLKKLQQGAYKGYMGEKRKALVDRFGYDPKNAAHLIRLLRMAVEFLETGEVNVYRHEDRDELRHIKQGGWTLERIQAEADNLFAQAKSARDRSPLPEKPDHDRAEALLMEMHADIIQSTLP